MINTNEGESGYYTTPKTIRVTNTYLAAKGACRHPFINGIRDAPLPKQWRALTLDPYNCNIDPNEHVVVYITQVSLYSTDDVVMDKTFATTLK